MQTDTNRRMHAVVLLVLLLGAGECTAGSAARLGRRRRKHVSRLHLGSASEAEKVVTGARVLNDDEVGTFNGRSMTVREFNEECTQAIRDLAGGENADGEFRCLKCGLLGRGEGILARYEGYYKIREEHRITFGATCLAKGISLPPLAYATAARRKVRRAVRLIETEECSGGTLHAIHLVKRAIQEAEEEINHAATKINTFIRKFESSADRIILSLKITKYGSFLVLGSLLSAGAPLWGAVAIGGGLALTQNVATQLGEAMAYGKDCSKVAQRSACERNGKYTGFQKGPCQWFPDETPNCQWSFKFGQAGIDGLTGAATSFVAFKLTNPPATTWGSWMSKVNGYRKIPIRNLKDLVTVAKIPNLEGIMNKHIANCQARSGKAYLHAKKDRKQIAASKALVDCVSLGLVGDSDVLTGLGVPAAEVDSVLRVSQIEKDVAGGNVHLESNVHDSSRCQEQTGYAKAECVDTSFLTCQGFTVSGLCPGSSAVKCCIPDKQDAVIPGSYPKGDDLCALAEGRCIHYKDASQNNAGKTCEGQLQSRKCAGPNERRCCVGDTSFPAESVAI